LVWGKGKAGAERLLSLSLPYIHELCHFDGAQVPHVRDEIYLYENDNLMNGELKKKIK